MGERDTRQWVVAHQAAVGAEAHVVGLEVAVEQLEAGRRLVVEVAQGLRQPGQAQAPGWGRYGLAWSQEVMAMVRLRRVSPSASTVPCTCALDMLRPHISHAGRARCRTAARAAAARP